ncbi:MAG TPA: methyltransferase domain-containing protein [Capsulimonadaceae bacterium]|nr:methyltransferase domain-containing protein [Capsulimonadaceae bacterium]
MNLKTLPLVEVACAVCGGGEMETVCTAEEIAAQQAYLPRFHKRRLKPDAAAEGALEERASFTQDYATQIVRCCACGLILRDPRPKDRAIRHMYEGDSYTRERLEAIFLAQREFYRPKAKQLSQWLAPDASVVEVGSFAGGFLAAAQERGWQALGIDPGKDVDEFCRAKGLPVLHGTLDDLTSSPESVDALAVWNTFDQLPDPGPTLAAAARLLRPRGILALRVPNGEFFVDAHSSLVRMRHTPLAPIAGWILDAMVWNNMLAFPYLYGYSVSTLDRLLQRYGFARRLVQPDTLVQLSDCDTRTWAVWEERAVKAFLRAVARTDGIRLGSRFPLAPWLDLYYEKSA